MSDAQLPRCPKAWRPNMSLSLSDLPPSPFHLGSQTEKPAPENPSERRLLRRTTSAFLSLPPQIPVFFLSGHLVEFVWCFSRPGLFKMHFLLHKMTQTQRGEQHDPNSKRAFGRREHHQNFADVQVGKKPRIWGVRERQNQTTISHGWHAPP